MTHVVAKPCFDCVYTDCVVVCPVDCFYQGETMSTSTRTNASTVKPAYRSAQSKRSSTKIIFPASGKSLPLSTQRW